MGQARIEGTSFVTPSVFCTRSPRRLSRLAERRWLVLMDVSCSAWYWRLRKAWDSLPDMGTGATVVANCAGVLGAGSSSATGQRVGTIVAGGCVGARSDGQRQQADLPIDAAAGSHRPLAASMRPANLAEFVGQGHLLAPPPPLGADGCVTHSWCYGTAGQRQDALARWRPRRARAVHELSAVAAG